MTRQKYYTKLGSDGRHRLYVDTVEEKVLKTRQGKKADMKKALDVKNNIESDLEKALLEYWDESDLPSWAKL